MQKPYVITISSEKGGVGKTTLATNLAIYLKAMNEDMPVTLFSFDNHFSVDRMFRIGRRASEGSVLDLFAGRTPESLVELGEYGVQFIPSSGQLGEARDQVTGVDLLARILAASTLTGVVVIDTRPDLDIFTRNALFAADRVIVPVKDAPSLENCRNLHQFFDHQGLSRRSIRLLPSLLDSRIRFQGPFVDSYQLIKAYAINRGYRCFDGFIAKSPKVESLNTNPEGKIYPVLTHGRGTEVHPQMVQVARQLSDEATGKERRLDQVAEEAARQVVARGEAFRRRRSELQTGCLLCGRRLVEAEAIAPAAYYAETSDGRHAGFIEENCFSDAIFRHFYGTRREIGPTDPLRDLFRESAQRSFFALRRAPDTRQFYQQQRLSLYRFDEDGLEVSHKTIEVPAEELKQEAGGLLPMLGRTLGNGEGRLGDEFLLVVRISADFPEEILYDEQHEHLLRVAGRVASQLKESS